MKSCADGAAVARCSIDFLSDSISPVVAPNSIHCGICLFGLGTASERGRFEVAQYWRKSKLGLFSIRSILIFRAIISDRKPHPEAGVSGTGREIDSSVMFSNDAVHRVQP